MARRLRGSPSSTRPHKRIRTTRWHPRIFASGLSTGRKACATRQVRNFPLQTSWPWEQAPTTMSNCTSLQSKYTSTLGCLCSFGESRTPFQHRVIHQESFLLQQLIFEVAVLTPSDWVVIRRLRCASQPKWQDGAFIGIRDLRKRGTCGDTQGWSDGGEMAADAFPAHMADLVPRVPPIPPVVVAAASVDRAASRLHIRRSDVHVLDAEQ